MKIRVATIEDSQAISYVFAKTWQYAYRDILPDTFLDNLSEDTWVASFKHMFTQTSIVTYVATEGSLIVGAIINDMTVGRIIALNVLSDYHHIGVGKQLMLHALNQLCVIHKEIYVHVIKDNYPARRFYEKLGFVNTKKINRLAIADMSIEEYIYTYQSKEK